MNPKHRNFETAQGQESLYATTQRTLPDIPGSCSNTGDPSCIPSTFEQEASAGVFDDRELSRSLLVSPRSASQIKGENTCMLFDQSAELENEADIDSDDSSTYVTLPSRKSSNGSQDLSDFDEDADNDDIHPEELVDDSEEQNDKVHVNPYAEFAIPESPVNLRRTFFTFNSSLTSQDFVDFCKRMENGFDPEKESLLNGTDAENIAKVSESGEKFPQPSLEVIPKNPLISDVEELIYPDVEELIYPDVEDEKFCTPPPVDTKLLKQMKSRSEEQPKNLFASIDPELTKRCSSSTAPRRKRRAVVFRVPVNYSSMFKKKGSIFIPENIT